MFRFFGAMIGWAIRSTSSLNLDLPPIFWKKILGIEPDEWDLKTIDNYTWQMVQGFREKYLGAKGTSEASLMKQGPFAISHSLYVPVQNTSLVEEGDKFV
jgi:hypothetical protein